VSRGGRKSTCGGRSPRGLDFRTETRIDSQSRMWAFGELMRKEAPGGKNVKKKEFQRLTQMPRSCRGVGRRAGAHKKAKELTCGVWRAVSREGEMLRKTRGGAPTLTQRKNRSCPPDPTKICFDQ